MMAMLRGRAGQEVGFAYCPVVLGVSFTHHREQPVEKGSVNDYKSGVWIPRSGFAVSRRASHLQVCPL